MGSETTFARELSVATSKVRRPRGATRFLALVSSRPGFGLTPQYSHQKGFVVAGQSMEAEFGVHLTIGPALERGFYYDCHSPNLVFTQVIR